MKIDKLIGLWDSEMNVLLNSKRILMSNIHFLVESIVSLRNYQSLH